MDPTSACEMILERMIEAVSAEVARRASRGECVRISDFTETVSEERTLTLQRSASLVFHFADETTFSVDLLPGSIDAPAFPSTKLALAESVH